MPNFNIQHNYNNMPFDIFEGIFEHMAAALTEVVQRHWKELGSPAPVPEVHVMQTPFQAYAINGKLVKKDSGTKTFVDFIVLSDKTDPSEKFIMGVARDAKNEIAKWLKVAPATVKLSIQRKADGIDFV